MAALANRGLVKLRCGIRCFALTVPRSLYASTTVATDTDKEGNDGAATWAERLQETEDLPKWMTTKKQMRKLYARYGRSSGFEPGIIWPTKAELEEIIEEETEYYPTLLQMQDKIESKRQREEKERIKREKHIAACMARMPKLIKQFYDEKGKKKEQQRLQKLKRDNLLLEAKEKFGYAIDPRHPKFQKYIEEVEKQERKRRKELKRKGIVLKS